MPDFAESTASCVSIATPTGSRSPRVCVVSCYRKTRSRLSRAGQERFWSWVGKKEANGNKISALSFPVQVPYYSSSIRREYRNCQCEKRRWNRSHDTSGLNFDSGGLADRTLPRPWRFLTFLTTTATFFLSGIFLFPPPCWHSLLSLLFRSFH